MKDRSSGQLSLPLGWGDGREEDWDFADADTKTHTHGYHVYPAMMIPQVARRLIRSYGGGARLLLDPFYGSGTSLVEAQLAGLDAVGIDLNPFAVLLARAKTTDYTICNHKPSEWRGVLAAASPAGWPPPEHGAAARLRRAAAPQNTIDSHSKTLCIKLVLQLAHSPEAGPLAAPVCK